MGGWESALQPCHKVCHERHKWLTSKAAKRSQTISSRRGWDGVGWGGGFRSKFLPRHARLIENKSWWRAVHGRARALELKKHFFLPAQTSQTSPHPHTTCAPLMTHTWKVGHANRTMFNPQGSFSYLANLWCRDGWTRREQRMISEPVKRKDEASYLNYSFADTQSTDKTKGDNSWILPGDEVLRSGWVGSAAKYKSITVRLLGVSPHREVVIRPVLTVKLK